MIYIDNVDIVVRIRYKYILKVKYRSYWKVFRYIVLCYIVVNVLMILMNCLNIKLDFDRCINFIF